MNVPQPQIPRSKPGIAVPGIVMIILGIVIVAGAGDITVLLARLVGAAILVYGLFQLGSTLVANQGFQNAPLSEMLVAGLILLVGIIIVMFPASFVSALFSLLGMVILLSGVADLVRARDDVRAESPIPQYVIAIATILVGAAVTAMPFAAAEIAPMACGVALIVNGASELFLAWKAE